MDLEVIILSEVRGGQAPYEAASMWNLKFDANALIYETEADSQTRSADLWVPRGEWRREGSGVEDQQMQTIT